MLLIVLMALSCDSVDNDICGFERPDPFVASIENVSETYATDEAIFLTGEISSMVPNTCNQNNTPDLVTDNTLLRDAIFVLKLNDSLFELNAEIVGNIEVNYIIGEQFNSSCFGAIEYVPELSEDNLIYSYRLSITISEPGDYVIVNGFNLVYTTEENNNVQIFEPYNTLGNIIKFDGCDNTFTRVGTQDQYFFTVE